MFYLAFLSFLFIGKMSVDYKLAGERYLRSVCVEFEEEYLESPV